MTKETIKPADEVQLLDAVQWALSEETTFDVTGLGSKQAFGCPVEAAHKLDLSDLTGITLYEPNELVMTAKAGTPMAAIEAALDEHNQQLAFEPMDMTSVFGSVTQTNASGTIGGVLACNLAGPRRVSVGAARDHILGFQAVSGRAEIFKSGGRVVKNVTGFDLSKLMTGSFGTLALMTEVTFKVLPKPEKSRTVLVIGAEGDDAARAMSRALGSAYEVGAACHLPVGAAARSSVSYVKEAGRSVSAIRVGGPGPSVEARAEALRDLLSPFGETEELHSTNSKALWQEVRDARFVTGHTDRQIWRLSVPPMSGPAAAQEILDRVDGECFFDWGGGLVWLALKPFDDASEKIVRATVQKSGGHATLVRAEESVRRSVPVFQPQVGPIADLSKRVKEAFDPKGIFNPGKMG